MHDDTLIIGGSFAGLAAATYLARGRRTVRIVDAGLPRNRFTPHSHGFLTHDGSEPSAMLAAGRAQVAAYPTVRFTQGVAAGAERENGGESFRVTLEGGEVLEARRLVLAFGVSDELPDVPGVAERWGKTAIHCPYCHGYEFSDQRLGVLYLSEKSLHQAQLVREWGPVTLFLNGAEVGAEALVPLLARGVTVEPAAISGLVGKGTSLSAVALTDGREVTTDAIYVAPRTQLNSAVAEQLGCELEETPMGPVVRTDAMKLTTVPGVYAAGDITRGMHTVAFAVADGVNAGLAAHRSLIGMG